MNTLLISHNPTPHFTLSATTLPFDAADKLSSDETSYYTPIEAFLNTPANYSIGDLNELLSTTPRSAKRMSEQVGLAHRPIPFHRDP